MTTTTISTDTYREVAELLGYRICDSHTEEVGEDVFRLGVLASVGILAQMRRAMVFEPAGPRMYGPMPDTGTFIRAAALIGHDSDLDDETVRSEERAVDCLSAIVWHIDAMVRTFPDTVDNGDVYEFRAHNVAAGTGFIDCDDPLHNVKGGCCGPVTERP